MDYVSLEDDKEKEKSQHHVTKVTEDVVECTVEGSLIVESIKRLRSHCADACDITHLRAPSGWAHRKL